MQRLPIRLRPTRLSLFATTFPLPPTAHFSSKTSSSPASASGPSAESGGSHSKSAAESSSGGSGSDNRSAPSPVPDSLAGGDMRGRTGGGEPLEGSVNPPPQPRIANAGVPGDGDKSLSAEQRREVEQHNREFEEKHDRAESAANDRVNKKFWSGGGERAHQSGGRPDGEGGGTV